MKKINYLKILLEITDIQDVLKHLIQLENYYFMYEKWTIFLFFFLWPWGLNSGLCAYKAGILTLEPHLHVQQYLVLIK
jgi:hypothetical protein